MLKEALNGLEITRIVCYGLYENLDQLFSQLAPRNMFEYQIIRILQQ